MERLLERIDAEITAAGGKRSRSRAQIIEVFFRSGRHLTVEALTRKVRARNRNIGAATVYRTLKLLARLGYAKELDFGEGAKRYESSLAGHHDHLVCTGCGTVAEFEEPRIEVLQEEVARRHGFSPTMHRLSIYGYCPKCVPRNERESNLLNGMEEDSSSGGPPTEQGGKAGRDAGGRPPRRAAQRTQGRVSASREERG